MKFFIVGFHASGKQEIINTLKQEGIPCGKLFTNINKEDIYNASNFEIYDNADIRDIFENNAYIFIHEMGDETLNCFEGLGTWEYDNNSVFSFSPDQFMSIPKSKLKDELCIVLLDNTQDNRRNRFSLEGRSYSFLERERAESINISTYIEKIYNTPHARVIYFNNEDPQRVAGLIHIMYEHPEYISYLEKKFN